VTVGRFDRVYQIQPHFRNEGVPRSHPEFTMLEFYEAYSNYRDLMDLNEHFSRLGPHPHGLGHGEYDGVELDFSKIQRLSMREAIVNIGQGSGESSGSGEVGFSRGPREATAPL